MTRDDIINLMQQACDPDKRPAWHNEFWTITQQELERFADLVLRAERKPLTDEEIAALLAQSAGVDLKLNGGDLLFARAIERANKLRGEQ